MYFFMINFIVFVMGVLFSCYNVWAGPQLKNIQTYTSPNSFEVNYIFTENINTNTKAVIDFINETVQLDLENLEIPEGKRFSMLSDEKVRNLYTYQLNPQTLRLRVIYKSGNIAENFKGKVSSKIEANVLKVKIVDGRVGIPLTLPEKEVAKVEEERKKELPERVAITNEELEKIFEQPKEEIKKEKKTDKEVEKLVAEIKKKVEAGADEKEIPVLVGNIKRKETQAGANWHRIVLSLLVVLGAGGLILLGIKKALKNKSNTVGSKIKLITQYHLGPKKSLGIVRVAGEFILVGITDHNINHIKTLSILDEDLPNEVPQEFDSTLKDYQLDEEMDFKEEEEDSFAISGIKDVVAKRLKGMRQI